MSDLLNKLRSDFELVSRHCVESGEWTKDDAAEFGRAIKATVERKDDAVLVLWARDMAIRANAVIYHTMIVKGVEATMRARAADERNKAAAK